MLYPAPTIYGRSRTICSERLLILLSVKGRNSRSPASYRPHRIHLGARFRTTFVQDLPRAVCGGLELQRSHSLPLATGVASGSSAMRTGARLWAGPAGDGRGEAAWDRGWVGRP